MNTKGRLNVNFILGEERNKTTNFLTIEKL